MLNIRGMIALSAVSPVVIATAMSVILAACAPPQSRFRGPVNLSGSGAPTVGPQSADPTAGSTVGTNGSVFSRPETEAAQTQAQTELAQTDGFETMAYAKTQLKSATVGIDSEMMMTLVLESKTEGQPALIFSGDLEGLLLESAPRANLSIKGTANTDLKAYVLLVGDSSVDGQKTQSYSLNVFVEGLEKDKAVKLNILSKVEMNQTVKKIGSNKNGKLKDVTDEPSFVSSTVVSEISSNPDLNSFVTVLNYTTDGTPNELRFAGRLEEGSTLVVTQKNQPVTGEAKLVKRSQTPGVIPGVVISLNAQSKELIWAMGSDTELATLIAEEVTPETSGDGAQSSGADETPAANQTEGAPAADSPTTSSTSSDAQTLATQIDGTQAGNLTETAATSLTADTVQISGTTKARYVYTIVNGDNGKSIVVQDVIENDDKECAVSSREFRYEEPGLFTRVNLKTLDGSSSTTSEGTYMIPSKLWESVTGFDGIHEVELRDFNDEILKTYDFVETKIPSCE